MSVVTPASDGTFLSKHPLSFLSACWFAVTLIAGCHSSLAQQLSFPNQSTPPAEGSAVLPVPQPQFRGVIGRKASDSTPDFPKGVTAPTGAPNVLLIMTDDTGFGAASTFGGPIPTPTLDRLAKSGLRYTSFIPPRCVPRLVLRFSLAATIRASVWGTSRSLPRDIRATPPSCPRVPARSAIFSWTTATTRRGSESTT